MNRVIPRIFGPPEGGPIIIIIIIVFTFTGIVRNVRNDVNIIYICQQHGGREVGT